MLKRNEDQDEDIVTIVDECDRCTKVGFLPEVEASYLGLLIHVMDLTSLNSTDNQKTIEALVDKVLRNNIQYSFRYIIVLFIIEYCLNIILNNHDLSNMKK